MGLKQKQNKKNLFPKQICNFWLKIPKYGVFWVPGLGNKFVIFDQKL